MLSDVKPCQPAADNYVIFYFGLLVTGKGEKEALPELFQSIGAYSENHFFVCHFEVIDQIGQRSPKQENNNKKLQIVGTNKQIPTKDVEDISFNAKKYLRNKGKPCAHVILIDDLESGRKDKASGIYQRYRHALDELLTPDEQERVAVHFMVNMLEAYYFADTRAINAILGLDLEDYDGDVEEIGHPKNELKKLCKGKPKNFDEKADALAIIEGIDVEHVLANPNTCKSLRTLFKWIWCKIGQPEPDKYHCNDGVTWEVTDKQ